MSDSCLAERKTLAEEHVRKGRIIVERQCRLITEMRTRRLDVTAAEELLKLFESSLLIFEQDLAAMGEADATDRG